MDFNCKINPELTVPIYRQLADAITYAIKKGELEDKHRLPTVNELSDELGVARGTVKKAYDELEKSGLLEKVQGRGTFVNFRSDDLLSRKERAMISIDSMLDNLESLGFSAAEINIFLNLKLKERAEKTDKVKIALFECNPEVLSFVSEQIREIHGIELFSYLLDTVKKSPYKIEENFDLAITTQSHFEEVSELLIGKTRVIRGALRLSSDCLSSILKIRAGQKIGIASYSQKFGNLLYSSCEHYTEDVLIDKPFIFLPDSDIKNYLKDKNILVLPLRYEKYCSADTLKSIRNFKGQIIICSFEFDEGSVLYIKEKTKRILESKSL